MFSKLEWNDYTLNILKKILKINTKPSTSNERITKYVNYTNKAVIKKLMPGTHSTPNKSPFLEVGY